ncbi:uncharacterized protein LOC131327768 [Rhododendron vialii]|uniref:uncharacterized protein LOC131327768 n=1 Tax=Rhododendron vialii TaxID=182163 RepID=UPI00265D96C9|nr:uncharacterized protein LOC131327768 [Rhododendron vialii]
MTYDHSKLVQELQQEEVKAVNFQRTFSIKPRHEIIQFCKKGKLSPRYIGPFETLERIGEIADRLTLPPQIAKVHNVFHVSMLRKYVARPTHVLNWEEVTPDEDTTFEE